MAAFRDTCTLFNSFVVFFIENSLKFKQFLVIKLKMASYFVDYSNDFHILDVSPRLNELVRSKAYHKLFKADRPSPIWQVPRPALRYPEKPRLKQLSKPKLYHKSFVPDRPVHSEVSEAAQHTAPTKR